MMHGLDKYLLCLYCLSHLAFPVLSRERCFDDAFTLYESGLYARAMEAFQALPQFGSDPIVDGYVALCAIRQKTAGYETAVSNYILKYPSTSLADDLRIEQAFDLFDKQDYAGALEYFQSLKYNRVPKSLRNEYVFKKGYSFRMTGDTGSAVREFETLCERPLNDFSAPAQYCLAYILYMDRDFDRALALFEKASADERFTPIANYYALNCRYCLGQYDKVVESGPEMYDSGEIPEDKKAFAARLISESYLICGDKANARRYFSVSEDGTPKTRADYFFIGSLMYSTGDYTEAVSSYAKMNDKSDSLGQIAWYQTALAYIALKDKLDALDAFRQAASLRYDAKITEDAAFNYAKLAFDVNGDTAPFAAYCSDYADKVRGEQVFSYMALASLQNRDYAAAIEFYDKIETLDRTQESNYVHASYLRGAQLLENGSYRNAAECMRVVSYYTPKDDRVNQLARYALAEALYRDGKYAESESIFRELYNASALYGLKENEALAYNIAYARYKSEEFADAVRWFDIYLAQGDMPSARDALLRKGDCLMVSKEYKGAVDSYSTALARYGWDEIYPYYQCALACGLLRDNAGKLAMLEKVTEASPDAPFYSEALFELGKARLDNSDRKSAMEAFRMLVDKAPDPQYKAKAMLEMGTLYRNGGNADSALLCYKTVVEKMPASAYVEDALLAIESIYQSQGTPQKHLDYLDSIGRGGTKSADERETMFFNAAEQMFYSGNYAKAISALVEFKNAWPSSARVAEADFYLAECYRFGGDKVLACDFYSKVMAAGKGPKWGKAVINYANLNYSLDNLSRAYDAYKELLIASGNARVRLVAVQGMMRSSFRAKDYTASLDASRMVAETDNIGGGELREALMTQAKSLVFLSRRDEARDVFAVLAEDPGTAEGAEASYMLVLHYYDKGDFENVKNAVYAFADSGTPHQYWLAKSFIILGDYYAELGKIKQAEATFRSIADGYAGKDDDVSSELKVRLDKLAESNKEQQ